MSTIEPNPGDTRSRRPPFRSDTDMARELRYLVRSVEPAIVFSSVAHLCVPTFSEGCTVDIVEDGEVAYRISYPRSANNGTGTARNPTNRRTWTDRGYAVRTRFASVGYTGMMTHLWRTRVPTPADVSRALVLVRIGVDTVGEERQDARRQDARTRDGHDTAEQLRVVAAVTGALDPAVEALLEARAQRLRQWARCEREGIARL